MPIIPAPLLNCVFYLYKDRESAQKGEAFGGTGFLIAEPTANGLGHHYAVSNWHVAVRDGFSCIRINLVGGGFEVFDTDPSDWLFDAGKDDVAIVPIDIRSDQHLTTFVGTNLLVHEQAIADARIGPGDDVFMIGRFIDLNDSEANTPAVRFGNISTPPVRIDGINSGPCYCIDMHSRTGFSGSPVFVYRTPGSSLEWAIGMPVDPSHTLLALLGVHVGQFPEKLPIKTSKMNAHPEYVEGVSGMTIVVPAWKIRALLDKPELVERRQRMDAVPETGVPKMPSPIEKSAKPTKGTDSSRENAVSGPS